MASIAELDRFRMQEGSESARNMFYSLCMKNASLAIGLLNDEKLAFPTLFILKPEISKLSLQPYLSKKNQWALELAKNIIYKKKAYNHKKEDFSILQWIFQTGSKETQLGVEYDKIMDSCAILLIKEYQDKTCLKPLMELIFNRYKNGRYTYDAEWAFFESRNVDCLTMIAKRLLSSDYTDVELARKLLQFIPCMKNGGGPVKQHDGVKKWVRENEPYLYYTGESSQKSASPCLFEISYQAKYLQQPLHEDDIIPAASHLQHADLHAFAGLEKETQKLISHYSQKLQANNRNLWNKWIRSPLPDQIKTAKRYL